MKRIIYIAASAALLLLGATPLKAQTGVGQALPAVQDAEAQQATATRSRDVLAIGAQRMSSEQTYSYIEQLCGTDDAEQWNSGARAYRAGKGLLISSAVTIPVGLVVCGTGTAIFIANTVGGSIGSGISSIFGGDTQFDPELKEKIATGGVLMIGGAAVAVVGIGTLIAGSVCLPVGKSKMNEVVEHCNGASRNDVTLNIGACRHGIGISLNF